MRIISPSVSIITEKDPFKKIEKVGRTCYKSEDKITEDSAKKFYRGLVSRKHTAMVEHTTFLFKLDRFQYDVLQAMHPYKYLNFTEDKGRCLISGNLRAINESEAISLCKALYDLDPELVYNEDMKLFLETYEVEGKVSIIDFSELKNPTENEFMNHFYMTFLYTTDRGVTHEMVRHRPASYAQESTRYCNYSKDQFGNEITIIKPTDWDDWKDINKLHFCTAVESCEREYFNLIRNGLSPQQARAVLPNALKTEIIMTACAGELEHFFDLRSRGITGAPHPDIKTVADMALTMYEVERYMTLGF